VPTPGTAAVLGPLWGTQTTWSRIVKVDGTDVGATDLFRPWAPPIAGAALRHQRHRRHQLDRLTIGGTGGVRRHPVGHTLRHMTSEQLASIGTFLAAARRVRLPPWAPLSWPTATGRRQRPRRVAQRWRRG
jgi:hypothetical protein